MDLKKRDHVNWRRGQYARFVGNDLDETFKDMICRVRYKSRGRIFVDFVNGPTNLEVWDDDLEAIPKKLWPNIEASEALFPAHKILWDVSVNPEHEETSD